MNLKKKRQNDFAIEKKYLNLEFEFEPRALSNARTKLNDYDGTA
jgi:hypothetical protein